MGTYLVQRFGEAIPVVFLSSVLIFLGLRLIPGDQIGRASCRERV